MKKRARVIAQGFLMGLMVAVGVQLPAQPGPASGGVTADEVLQEALGIPATDALPVQADTLEELNLQLLTGRVDLNILRMFPRVKRLTLPYFVSDLGPVADGTYTQVLYLSVSNTNITCWDIQAMQLPELRYLDVSESAIEELACLEVFDKLDTLVVARGQFADSNLSKYQWKYHSVFVLQRGRQSLHPRRFTQQELNTWVLEKVDYPKAARQAGVSGRVDIRFTILPNGRVAETEVIGKLGYGIDEMAERIVRGLRFEPGVGRDVRTAYLYFRPVSTGTQKW